MNSSAKNIRVLLVEDSENDALLTLRQLKRGGFAPDYLRVDTRAALEQALRERTWDIILCDYKMPGFDGSEALKVVQGSGKDIPFILISGTIGEETAVSMMKAGAHDFLLKNALGRLVPAVERELKEAAVRREKQQQEAYLRKSERNLKKAEKIAKLGNWEWDLLTNEIIWSDEVYRIYGLDRTKDKLSYDIVVQSVAPEDRDRFLKAVDDAVKHGAPFEGEYRAISPDGRERFARTIGEVIRDQDGRPVSMFGVVIDVTKRKEMEEALRSSQLLYQDLVETAQDLIWQCDAEGRYTYLNPAWGSVYGYRVEEMLGHKFTDFQTPETARHDSEVFARLLRSGVVSNYETVHRSKDGRDIHLIFNAKPVMDSHGKVIGTRGTAYDITERKRAEETLALLKHSVDNASDAAFWTDREGKFVYVNTAACSSLGYDRDALLNMHIYDVNPSSTPEGWSIAWEKYRKLPGIMIESTHRRKDGTVFPVEISSTFVSFGAQELICGFARDISDRKQSEEALQHNEDRLSRAQAISHVGDWEWDIATNVVHWSDELYRIYGYEPLSVQPDYGLVLERMHPRSKDEFQKAIDAALKEDRHFEMDYRFFRTDGTEAALHTIGQVIRDPSGAPVRMLGIVQDITERIEAERRLRESEDKFRSIFEHAIDGIMIADPENNRNIEANKAICAMLGYTRDEIINHRVEDMHPKDGLARVLELFQRQARGEISLAPDVPMLRKDGSVVYADVNATRVILGGKQCLIGIFRDITERKQTDAALRHREKQLADSQRIAHIGSWEHNLTTNNVFWSDELFRIMGLDPRTDPADFNIFFDMIHPDDRQILKNGIEETVKTGKTFSVDYRFNLRDGRQRILHAQAELIHDETGTQNILTGTGQDITERKRMEDALHLSETRYRQLFESIQEGFMIQDIVTDDAGKPVDVRYLEVNSAIERFLGKTRAEIIGQTRNHVLGIPDPAVVETISRVAATGQPHHMVRYSDGADRWYESFSYSFGPGQVATLVLDITERKQAEEKIRQNEQFIRNILDTVDEGFIVIDRNYRILTANRAYCGQVNRPCDDIIGKNCFAISHNISRPCYEEGEECAVRQVFATGMPHAALHKHSDHEGHMLYVETKGFPIKDASGTVISVIETINNITEKHLLEEERLKTQKLESIGTLAGGIAHDFNNLLQGIFGYISMAKMTHDQKERSLSMLEQAEKALHLSVNLTSQLLTFSKGGKPVRKRISLFPVIENAAKFALSGSRSDFRLDIAPGLWQADADAGQLGQVIQNIVLNADQAMPLGGNVVITARNIAGTEPDLPQGLEKKDHVLVTIEDSGVGIAEEYLSKIFDPYFTTKEKGSGLGLATSYSIIKNHAGQIRVTSTPGKGSVFSLYLPAVSDSAVAPVKAADPPGARKGRILIMDDEEIVRMVAGELIGALGHETAFSAHGEAALQAFRDARAAGRPFDVIILDLTIRGGMGGAETARKMLEIDPDAKIVVSSGYSDDLVTSTYREHGFRAFLKKPYDLTELQAILNDLLA